MELITLAPGRYFQGNILITAQSHVNDYAGSSLDLSLYNKNINSDFRHIVLSLEMLNFISFITKIFKVTQFVNTESF